MRLLLYTLLSVANLQSDQSSVLAGLAYDFLKWGQVWVGVWVQGTGMCTGTGWVCSTAATTGAIGHGQNNTSKTQDCSRPLILGI